MLDCNSDGTCDSDSKTRATIFFHANDVPDREIRIRAGAGSGYGGAESYSQASLQSKLDRAMANAWTADSGYLCGDIS